MLTKMSDSSQHKSDPPHHHSLDGESSDGFKDATVPDAARVPERDFQCPAPVAADERFYPPLKLDVARYEELLADFDMSEEERVALLEAMWNIVVSFVDLGFDLHPMQQIATAAEQDSKDVSD
jgi:hypothetical protein